MQIAVLAVGSRGDVQPMLILARALRAAGHNVRLATHEAYAPLAREYGLELAVALDNPFTGMNAGVGNTAAAGERATEAAEPFAARFERALEAWMRGSLEASQGADAIAFAQLCFVGEYVGEKLGIPALRVNYSPMTPTAAFPSIYAVRMPRFSPALNRLSYVVERVGAWLQMRGPINRSRRAALGLPPVPRGRISSPATPLLNEYSPAVLPRPADWPDHVQVTGFWLPPLPTDFTPDPELLAFLEAGAPPIYLGLGSVANSNPIKVTRALLNALASLGARTIVSPGQVSLEGWALPRETYVDRGTPHTWLFPRSAGVICHGGIGTLGSALHAGVPSLSVTFFGEQAFWGRHMYELGVAPPPLRADQITPQLALERVRSLVEDRGLRQRAAELGAQVRADRGVERAVELIEELVGRSAAQPARVTSTAAARPQT